MLDADYFTTVLPEQMKKHGSSVTVTVHLYTGAHYHAHALHDVKPGYVVLEVYPPEGTEPKLKDDWTHAHKAGQTAFNTDMVALPYESIQRVLTTTSSPADAARVGFRRSSSTLG